MARPRIHLQRAATLATDEPGHLCAPKQPIWAFHGGAARRYRDLVTEPATAEPERRPGRPLRAHDRRPARPLEIILRAGCPASSEDPGSASCAPGWATSSR